MSGSISARVPPKKLGDATLLPRKKLPYAALLASLILPNIGLTPPLNSASIVWMHRCYMHNVHAYHTWVIITSFCFQIVFLYTTIKVEFAMDSLFSENFHVHIFVTMYICALYARVIKHRYWETPLKPPIKHGGRGPPILTYNTKNSTVHYTFT